MTGDALLPAGADISSQPLGEALPGAPDWFRASAYNALDFFIHQQLLESPLRTHDIHAADMVYVPIYLEQIAVPSASGPCAQQLTQLGQDELLTDFWDNLATYLPELGNVPHWITISAVQLGTMKGCGGWWGISFLCNDQTSKFIFTVPDVFSGHHVQGIQFAGSSRPFFANVVAVPYFGHVHQRSHSGVDLVRHRSRVHEQIRPKPYLTSMIFTPTRNTQLRPKLISECLAVPDELCIHGSSGGVYQQIRLQHDSLFCIQPYGDLPTRIAFFDCIGLGETLPVVFDRHMVANLAFADVLSYDAFTITMPLQHALSASVNVIAELHNLEASSIAARLAALKNVSHVMTYSFKPQHSLISFQSRWNIAPQDDAFTMSVKAVLRNLCLRGLFKESLCEA